MTISEFTRLKEGRIVLKRIDHMEYEVVVGVELPTTVLLAAMNVAHEYQCACGAWGYEPKGDHVPLRVTAVEGVVGLYEVHYQPKEGETGRGRTLMGLVVNQGHEHSEQVRQYIATDLIVVQRS